MSLAISSFSTPNLPECYPGLVGNTPAYAPSVLLKGGIQLVRDNVFDRAFTAVTSLMIGGRKLGSSNVQADVECRPGAIIRWRKNLRSRRVPTSR